MSRIFASQRIFRTRIVPTHVLPCLAHPRIQLPARSIHHSSNVFSSRRSDPVTDDFYDPLVNILEDDSVQIRVAKVTPTSIKLADGLITPPNCIFLDGKVFEWSPPEIDPMKAMPNGSGWEAWDDSIWSLFELVSPKPEILIIGTGNTVLPVPNRIRSYLHSLGIQLDVQNTKNACSSFNLLSEEGRRVAAALLPMK